ncbi:respiratory nitrate reductase subunit gamma [Bacillus massilinigeriensis]|uniref:respiratory nitrate reductase subunit gamma n=1 Tax=Bacillus massilionigeriensis TaxID=1805475 RepID=UPI00096B5323|nr:respiratory nitrate reductase subunit gamma [Bacillus massilionigeriensis]
MEELKEMEIFQTLLWIVYPYIVFAVFGMGVVWQNDVEEVQAQQNQLVIHERLINRVVVGLMGLSVLTGLAVVYYTRINNEPRMIFDWVMSVLRLHPDTDIIRNISFLSRVHFVILLTSILLISFTNYLPYLLKPYLLFRRKVITRKNI